MILKFEEGEGYGYMFRTLKSLIFDAFNHIYELFVSINVLNIPIPALKLPVESNLIRVV